MLSAGQRMRRRDEFTSALRSGRRARRGDLVIHLQADPAADTTVPARAGFVIPRAVGNAVTRNTVRRRLRHLLHDRLGALPADAKLVVRALPGVSDRSFVELGRDLDAALAAVRRTEVRR